VFVEWSDAPGGRGCALPAGHEGEHDTLPVGNVWLPEAPATFDLNEARRTGQPLAESTCGVCGAQVRQYVHGSGAARLVWRHVGQASDEAGHPAYPLPEVPDEEPGGHVNDDPARFGHLDDYPWPTRSAGPIDRMKSHVLPADLGDDQPSAETSGLRHELYDPEWEPADPNRDWAGD
jgi:hypothetical protein